MATAWSYWLPRVLPHVPGCPTRLAEAEIRNAAQALLMRAHVWKTTLAAAAVVTSQRAVTPTLPASSKLARVLNAWYDTQQLAPASIENLAAEFGDDWAGHTGTPNSWYQESPGVVSLYPLPDADAATGLKLQVALAPSDDAANMPDDLAQRFSDAIESGARGRLMVYPGKPWSAPDLGVAYLGAFNAAVDGAVVAAARSFGNARIASRVRWC